jgi:hypothetical protein
MIIGKIRQNKKQLRLGLKLFVTPSVIITSILMHHMIWKLAIKPTAKDLVGVYKLTDSSAKINGQGTLCLYANGTFIKSFLPNHGLCEKGKYKVYEDEIWFRCGTHSSVAKIKKGFTDFKIKFIIGTNMNNEADVIFQKAGN